MFPSHWRLREACLTLRESSTSRHFKTAEGEIKINVTFLPAASFSCLIADRQRGLGGLRRFWCSFMKCFCIQTEIIKDFGWNAVQRWRKGGQSPLPLTLQRRCLMCFKSDSLTGLSPGLQPKGLVRQLVFRLQKVSLWILFTEMLFLKSSYPGHREKIPNELNRLYISLSLPLSVSCTRLIPLLWVCPNTRLRLSRLCIHPKTQTV